MQGDRQNIFLWKLFGIPTGSHKGAYIFFLPSPPHILGKYFILFHDVLSVLLSQISSDVFSAGSVCSFCIIP